MAYKHITMNDIPPSLKRGNNFSKELMNNFIKSCFDDTEMEIKETASTTNYYASTDKFYLRTSHVKKVTSVQIFNRLGDELEYTPVLNTNSYQNYLQLNRKLINGETLVVRYLATPQESDFFTDSRNQVYLYAEIYESLIKKLHAYAKACKNK